MKRYPVITFLLSMTLCTALASQTKPDQTPSGTVADNGHPNSGQVQPVHEDIRLTPDTIRAAQKKLNEEGYKSGTADGKLGPLTAGAIRKYQQDKGLKVTGTLDENTLSHLNVGAGRVMATAPGDIGHGAKAAGQDIKAGHPIAAGKALGKGVGHAGKAVGEGTKSAVVGAEQKTVGKKSDENTAPPPQ